MKKSESGLLHVPSSQGMIPEFSNDLLQCMRGFYYLTQTGNMTAAAAVMKRKQSALSHQIKSLENELGVKLFHGTKTHRLLTEEGKFLLAQVIEIAEVINDIKLSIGNLSIDVQGELSIATLSSDPFECFSEQMIAFCKRFPGIVLRHDCESSEEALFQCIELGNVNFGLINSENIPQEFESLSCFTSYFALLTPQKGPYALTDLPSLESLSQFPMLASPLRSRLWQAVSRQFRHYGCKPAYTHVIADREMLKQCVANGLGVTILDGFTAFDNVRADVNILPLTSYFAPSVYRLVWRSNLYLHPHLKLFLSFFTERTKEED